MEKEQKPKHKTKEQCTFYLTPATISMVDEMFIRLLRETRRKKKRTRHANRSVVVEEAIKFLYMNSFDDEGKS